MREGEFRLNIRKKCFTLSVATHRKGFFRAAVIVPSLEMFKAGLDGAWRNLVYSILPAVPTTVVVVTAVTLGEQKTKGTKKKKKGKIPNQRA